MAKTSNFLWDIHGIQHICVQETEVYQYIFCACLRTYLCIWKWILPRTPPGPVRHCSKKKPRTVETVSSFHKKEGPMSHIAHLSLCTFMQISLTPPSQYSYCIMLTSYHGIGVKYLSIVIPLKLIVNLS